MTHCFSNGYYLLLIAQVHSYLTQCSIASFTRIVVENIARRESLFWGSSVLHLKNTAIQMEPRKIHRSQYQLGVSSVKSKKRTNNYIRI